MKRGPGVRSMTGYGSHDFSVAGQAYQLELKTVNSRYADVRVRLPWPEPRLETLAVARVKKGVHRGRVELQLRAGAADGEAPKQADLAARFKQAQTELATAADGCDLPAPTAADVLAWLTATEADAARRRTAPQAMTEALPAAIDAALADLDAMRLREGAAMAEALGEILTALAEGSDAIEVLAAGQADAVGGRLAERVHALLDGSGRAREALDEARLQVEVALIADRVDVTEELIRLASHREQFTALLAGAGPHGRKLEFLLQEIHREVNTVGSKSQDGRITTAVVAAKGGLEKMREVIQNVE